MDLSRMLQRVTYAGAFTWSASDISGTLLQSRFIGPMCTMFQNASASQIAMNENTQLTPTLLNYISSYFHYWKGDIKLRFDVVATQMHTGRLFFGMNYGATPDSETSLRDATSQYGAIMDLNDVCHTYEFTIKYMAPTEWLNVCRGPQDPVVETSADWFVHYFMGSWSIRVLNKLTAPDNV